LKAADGSNYVCLFYEDCQEINPEEVVFSPDLCQAGRRFNPPPPPGEIIDTMEVHLCGADVTIQDNYVILSDGSIWRWSYASSWGDGIIVMGAAIIGAIIVATIGLARIVWRIWRKNVLFKTDGEEVL